MAARKTPSDDPAIDDAAILQWETCEATRREFVTFPIFAAAARAEKLKRFRIRGNNAPIMKPFAFNNPGPITETRNDHSARDAKVAKDQRAERASELLDTDKPGWTRLRCKISRRGAKPSQPAGADTH